MALTKELKSFYIAKIREIMVRRGADISGRDLVEILAVNKISITHYYAIQIRDKIIRERKHRIDMRLASIQVADLEDTNKILIEKCWDIIFNKDEQTHNRLMAMKQIRECKKDILDALMDAGAFNRQLGEVKVTHELSPSVKAAIECVRMHYEEKVKDVVYEEAMVIDKPKQIKEKSTQNDKSVVTNEFIIP